MKNVSALCIFFIFFLLTLTGCSWFNPPYEGEKDARTLAEEGTAAFVNEDYFTAIDAFTTLTDWYPFSKYAILAELKIADAHYHREEYEEAVFAYRNFEKLHPRNEAVPYVIYQTGMCWYKQINTVDRDQRAAEKSIALFTRLKETYPDSPYTRKAEARVKKCHASLAGHEFYVANFYLKNEQYKAALKRFEYLFANYPDTREAKLALEKIPQCREKIQDDNAS